MSPEAKTSLSDATVLDTFLFVFLPFFLVLDSPVLVDFFEPVFFVFLVLDEGEGLRSFLLFFGGVTERDCFRFFLLGAVTFRFFLFEVFNRRGGDRELELDHDFDLDLDRLLRMGDLETDLLLLRDGDLDGDRR